MTASAWDRYETRAQARRAAARELHPDHGGDPADLIAAWTVIDSVFGRRDPADAPATAVFYRRRRPARTWARKMRTRARRRKTRRYIQL